MRGKGREGEKDTERESKKGEGDRGKRFVVENSKSVGTSTGGVCAVLLQPYNILCCQVKTAHHGHPKLSPTVYITASWYNTGTGTGPKTGILSLI